MATDLMMRTPCPMAGLAPKVAERYAWASRKSTADIERGEEVEHCVDGRGCVYVHVP